jgi:hypothetical protein
LKFDILRVPYKFRLRKVKTWTFIKKISPQNKSNGIFGNYIRVQEQKLILKILKFDILPYKFRLRSKLELLFRKFHRRTNLMAFLEIRLPKDTSHKKFRLRNVDSWGLRKFHCSKNFMHFLLCINMWQVYNFTRALLAHKIFFCPTHVAATASIKTERSDFWNQTFHINSYKFKVLFIFKSIHASE